MKTPVTRIDTRKTEAHGGDAFRSVSLFGEPSLVRLRKGLATEGNCEAQHIEKRVVDNDGKYRLPDRDECCPEAKAYSE